VLAGGAGTVGMGIVMIGEWEVPVAHRRLSADPAVTGTAVVAAASWRGGRPRRGPASVGGCSRCNRFVRALSRCGAMRSSL
jgi:hypothetical protein